jgi:outer membrane immunogenic protein
VKLSGFVGQNKVWLDLKSNGLAVLDANQSGGGRNESLIAGGTALWAQGSMYALATVIGTWGQTTLKDAIGDCGYTSPPHPTGCNHNRYNFNTTGIMGTVTAGKVFDLPWTSGVKFDIRNSISYVHNDGDTFANVFGDLQRYQFSTWTGTSALTLFANMSLKDNALLRPYLMGYVRQEFAYRNSFDFQESGGGNSGTVREDQDHFYAGVDGGLTYTQGNMTVGAAIYYEASGDERTLGGRIGLSQKLDNALAPAKSGRFSWSGFYIGANAGRAWGDTDAHTSTTCHDVSLNAMGFAKGVDCPFSSPAQFAVIGAAGRGSMSDQGLTGGGQAGVNLQTGSMVFGLEVDLQSFKLGASRSGTAADPGNPGSFITVSTAFDTDWLFTARSRLGWAVAPSLLLYGTGGVALTELGVRNALSSSGPPVAEGLGSASGRVTGWTIGGGAEWALSRNWSVRAEYLYLDFGKTTANASVLDGGAHNFNNNVATAVDLTAHIARAGVNYKF